MNPVDPRFEDPEIQELAAAAADGLPFAPHAIHDPPYPIAGDPTGTTNDVLFCPDCLQTIISPMDDEIARLGLHFRVCWGLHGRRLPDDVRPCHQGCAIACGRRSKWSASS